MQGLRLITELSDVDEVCVPLSGKGEGDRVFQGVLETMKTILFDLWVERDALQRGWRRKVSLKLDQVLCAVL